MRYVIRISILILFFTSNCFTMDSKDPSSFSHDTGSGGSFPLYFIENLGQVDNETVKYYIKGADKDLFFTPQGITFGIKNDLGVVSRAAKRWTVRLNFQDINPHMTLSGEKRCETNFSYFRGDQSEWKSAVPAYTKLVYHDLWPGIDLVYDGTVKMLKYQFVVAPGADPKQIRMAYDGIEDLSITETGELSIKTAAGSLEDGKPIAYQMIDGCRHEVSMEYAPAESCPDDDFQYSFDLGDYNSSYPLVLDPAMIVYSGYLGGAGPFDVGMSIAVDEHGFVYVTGYTDSSETSFPEKTGPDLSYNGYFDVFVAKIKPDPTDPVTENNLVYCGYIGSAGDDKGEAIAVDGNGNAYITGKASFSEVVEFPVVGGPDLTFNGHFDMFVAKVNPSGTALVYCGYIGGYDEEHATDIAVDASGCAYIGGKTKSRETEDFPLVAGPDLIYGGGSIDGFIAKIKANPTHPVVEDNYHFCGYVGGYLSDAVNGIDVDDQGCVYLAGVTTSSQNQGFPAVYGPDVLFNNSADGFVAKLKSVPDDPNPLNNYHYCGYVGGTDSDHCVDIEVNEFGEAYLMGGTLSMEDDDFPLVLGPDLTHSTNYMNREDLFVAKLKSDPFDPEPANNYHYCGYLGGLREDYGMEIAIDGEGNLYITGRTKSDETSFPVTKGLDMTLDGQDDAFVARLNAVPDKSDPKDNYRFCSYIGGSLGDSGYGIAVDPYNRIYITGWTSSDETSFPVHGGPDLTLDGVGDAFITKIEFSPFIHVPGEVSTIQGAIDMASEGDVILVTPGTYEENVDFLGKSIHLRSDVDGDPWTVDLDPEGTVIDAKMSGTVVSMRNNEDSKPVMEGFTIYDGYAEKGGGIWCETDAVIRNNIITSCEAHQRGGGIYFINCAPRIVNNIIVDNDSDQRGGGIYGHTGNAQSGSETLIQGNLIIRNFAVIQGAGIFLRGEDRHTLVNNSISGNLSADTSAGLHCRRGSRVAVTNTIFWGNICSDAFTIRVGGTVEEPAEISLDYSIVSGGQTRVFVDPYSTLDWGPNMLDEDPLFVDLAHDDLHISALSPCINRGTNSHTSTTDFDGDARPFMGSVDIGADEYAGLHALAVPGEHGHAWEIDDASATTEHWPATNAIDGNTGSCWSSVGYPDPHHTEQFTFRFDEPRHINVVKVHPRFHAGTPLSFPRSFRICYLDNEVPIELLRFIDYPDPDQAGWIEFELPMTVFTDAIMIEGFELNHDDGPGFYFQLGEVSADFEGIIALPESTGGIIEFDLDAGPAHANRRYLILGSASGTIPGFPLPWNLATMPLNWDWFTDLVWLYKTSPLFNGFLGYLDSAGQSTAELNTGGPLPSGSAGKVLHFSFCMNNPFDYASNPIRVEIVP